MVTRRWVVLVTTLVLAGLACNGDSIYDASPLNFEIREGDYVASPPPPQIVLMVATQTVYRCTNYGLKHDFTASGDLLHVTVFASVTESQPCLDLEGPAGFRIALPVTIGTYTLEFTRLGFGLNGSADRYSMEVTDSTIEITTLEAHFTTPTAFTFPRP